MKSKYFCPLCKKNEAYTNDYGIKNVVVCRCKGLTEVGTIENGKFVPNPDLINYDDCLRGHFLPIIAINMSNEELKKAYIQYEKEQAKRKTNISFLDEINQNSPFSKMTDKEKEELLADWFI